jgi:hypothetical protein
MAFKRSAVRLRLAPPLSPVLDFNQTGFQSDPLFNQISGRLRLAGFVPVNGRLISPDFPVVLRIWLAKNVHELLAARR